MHSSGFATLPSLILHRAERTPDSIFVQVWDERDGIKQTVTYAELAALVLTTAQRLREEHDVKAGDYAAMLAHNSVTYLGVSFGVMTLGGVSLNLNYRQPVATTRQLLQGLTPRVLCCSAPFEADAQALSAFMPSLRVVQMHELQTLPCPPLAAGEHRAAEFAGYVSRLAGASNAAVFFTGGTTGVPKAVPHTHRGLLWLAEALLRFYPEPFEPDVPHAATLCFTPFFHVMGFVANTVFNLYAGCRMFILASHTTPLSPRLMLEATAALRPSVVNTVPWIVEGLVALVTAGELCGGGGARGAVLRGRRGR